MADVALLGAPGKPALAAEALREFSRRRGEAPALAALRLAALDAYLAGEPPDRVRHLWRFTDPAWLLPEALLCSPAAAALASRATSGDAARVGDDEAVVWLDGGAPRLSAAAAADSIQVTSLAEAGADLARLGAAVPASHGLFEALNAAAWSEGVLVRIPRGTTPARPLRVIVTAASGACLPRLLVAAEAGAEATVVEDHVGGGAAARVVGVTELFLASRARLRHVLLQRWTAGTAGHLTSRAMLDGEADLLTVIASLGGSVAKLDQGATLTGAGARSETVGIVLGEGRQHYDHHTLHQHVAGRTWSRLELKVALAGWARSAYTGLIRIEEGAPQSEAYQENRNLMLSDQCRVDTIPELEILTDEVVCTHGATVAPVDPEQLFYLGSRGLPPAAALRLAVRGFLEGTLQRLPEALRTEVGTIVEERLSRLGGGA